jgi:hypothetical protein
MAEPANPQGTAGDTERWIGRILLAVVLGEGIWGLLVSLTRDVIVPALSRVMGGDPQSPLYLGDGAFRIPGIFAAVLQFCLAGIVAIILNSYVNRGPRVVRVVTRVVSAPAFPAPVKASAPVPQAPAVPATAAIPAAPVNRPVPPPMPVVASAPPVIQPAPPAVPVAKAPTPPPAPPAKPAKPKKIYYNIVGEPVESDD